MVAGLSARGSLGAPFGRRPSLVHFKVTVGHFGLGGRTIAVTKMGMVVLDELV